ncbi:MAG: P-loop NTPase fold protein [Deltaproteobacteria bacterium]|nr:P-loop NTPase fold protein [Deltaproteobacteria bacterium]
MMNDEQKKGIQDLPITGELGEDGKFVGDALGIGQYADALSVFISECDTPITIAISGSWGSGKTSVMNMVRRKLEGKIVPIWFNCWQFSQFNLSANLSGVMVNFFVDEISKSRQDRTDTEKLGDSAREILTSCKWMLGTTLKAAASIGGIKADQVVDALISTIDSVYSFALFANRGSLVERGRVIFVVFSRFP